MLKPRIYPCHWAIKVILLFDRQIECIYRIRIIYFSTCLFLNSCVFLPTLILILTFSFIVHIQLNCITVIKRFLTMHFTLLNSTSFNWIVYVHCFVLLLIKEYCFKLYFETFFFILLRLKNKVYYLFLLFSLLAWEGH